MINLVIRRRSLPWDSISWDEFEKITFLEKDSLAVARHWNKTANISYLKFRAELKAIASECLDCVKDADILEAKYIDLVGILPTNAIIISLDDDDWLSPTIFRDLRAIRTDKTAMFVWNPGLWNWLVQPCPDIVNKDGQVMTVNSAMTCLRGSSYRQLIDSIIDEWPSSLGGPHMRETSEYGYCKLLWHRLSGRIKNALHKSQVAIAPPGLSVANRSLGSTTRLKKFGKYMRSGRRPRVLDSYRMPEPLAWSAKYVVKCRELAARTFCKEP